jgi:L-malate glycosyltransferase
VKGTTVAIIAPSMDILGGHAIQARALAQGLQTEGYGVVFIPINPSLSPPLRWLRRYRYARTIVNEACYLPTLSRLRRADLVHIFSASYWSFVLAPLPAILLARGFGKRVVLDYHSGEAADHLARWGPLVHPWLRLVDEIVVASEYLRDVFARYGYRARVIRNMVDTTRFNYRERRILRPRLLSTRNLEPHYQVDNTLRAFARVQARYPETTLTVAGSGSEEGRLRRLAASLGVAGIRFVGRVEPEMMPRLCDDADIFLNSSVIDNQPVSVLEAFAAGLPVVSTGTGDLAALVRDDVTGLTVPPGNPSAMAEAILKLLRNPQQAIAMSRRARQETERYTWAHVRQEWAAVYSGHGNASGGPGQPPAYWRGRDAPN